jgi:hypothetical protein
VGTEAVWSRSGIIGRCVGGKLVCATTTPPTDPADLAAYDAGRTAIADAVCAGLAAALAAGQLDGLPS